MIDINRINTQIISKSCVSAYSNDDKLVTKLNKNYKN